MFFNSHPRSVSYSISAQEGNTLQKLSAENVVKKGALAEMIARALREAAANINDVNTPAEAKRSIKLEITLKPMADRRNAEITLGYSTKFPGFNAVKSSVYVGAQKSGDPVELWADDPRQDELFAESSVEGTAKQ